MGVACSVHYKNEKCATKMLINGTPQWKVNIICHNFAVNTVMGLGGWGWGGISHGY